MDTVKYLVRVRCDTYNHAAYIKDALDGFCMQTTNFPFICTIFDDASTDGEPEIIRSYLQEHFELEDNVVGRREDTDDYTLIFARHKKNKNCYFAVYFLKYNHYSIKKQKLQYSQKFNECAKYVALCEGDDYWIDPYKLQKQFDALETHPTCSICLIKVNKVSRDGEPLGMTFPMANHIKPGIVQAEDFFLEEYSNNNWCFQTSSYFFRSELLFKEDTERNVFFSHFHVGDLPTLLWALFHGDGFYIDEIESCYRLFAGGFTTYRLFNMDWAINNLDKWLSAYSYIDKYTNYKYHKHISRKKGFKLLEKYYFQAKPLKMINVRFWWQYYKQPLWLVKLFLSFFPERYLSKLQDLWYMFKYKNRIKDMSVDTNFNS